MQIALTKKLATAMGIKPSSTQEVIDPLFSWTANWTNVWGDCKTEEMLVLVNNATRFTVAVYQVKRSLLKNVGEIVKSAILNTLLSMNINPEMVSEYMHLLGEIEFVQNTSRQAASWVSKSGLECACYIGNEYNGIENMFSDIVGVPANHLFVNYSGKTGKGFYPYKAMINALCEVTGKKAYKYRAFELSVILDLDIYKAVRKIIVPTNIQFAQLHKVLQSAFNWRNCHLYDFTVYDKNKDKLISRIVPFEEDLAYDEGAILMEGHTLSEFLSEDKYMIYTYDMGDNWQHEIQIVKVIDEYGEESPYLIEVSGQTPPENVGGVGGFVEFREIMQDPNHPEYEQTKAWAGYWSVELRDWEIRPRVIIR